MSEPNQPEKKTARKALTLRLDTDLWKDLSHEAVEEEVTLTDLITEALRRAVAERKRQREQQPPQARRAPLPA